MTAREVRRFVDDLLRGRRTKAFHAEEDEVAELQTAIVLRTARPGAGAPSEEFLSGLHRRLGAELSDDAGAASTPAASTPTASTPAAIIPLAGNTRRRFIQGASIAAASATIGAVGEHTLADNPHTQNAENTPQAGETLTPRVGAWRTVAASSELADAATTAFDLGSVTGFVHRINGRVRAVSGTCTHQGCQLMLDAVAPRLNCPCHKTSFRVTGELLSYQLPVAPGPLPQLAVRELDGAIQVYAPPGR